MKAFKLMMMAGLMAFAMGAQAQEKKVALTVNDVKIADGETADLVISMDYPTSETVVGLNFSLYLPDAIVLDGFDSKEAMLDGKASALKKACDLGDDGIWGEDADKGWLSVKAKADGGLLFVFIDQDDKTPFVSTQAQALSIKIKAIDDVEDWGFIKSISIANDENKSLDLNNIDDVIFGVNLSVDGISEISTNGVTTPTYNLQGVRVDGNAKGLVIRNGKKMIIK